MREIRLGLVDRETETKGQIVRTREVKKSLEKYEYCHNQTSLYYLLVVNEFLVFNPLNPELNPICYLLALLGAHHFLHVSRIWVKLLTFRLLMSYIYGAPILDVSRSHTTTQHSR